MFRVGCNARAEVVDADDLVALVHETIDQSRSDEPRRRRLNQGSHGSDYRSAGGAENCSSPPPAIGPALGGNRRELRWTCNTPFPFICG